MPSRLRDAGFSLSVLISIPFIVVFCAAYVANEHPAYVWDYGAYWGYFKNYAELISSGAPGWPARFFNEVNTLDYNPVAAVLLYPVYLLGGDGRAAYVTGISLLYLLPAVVIATLVAKQAAPSGNTSLVFLMALTYIPFWTPGLRGMVDIVGLIPLGLATLLLFRTNFLAECRLPYAALFGLLIYLPFLLRRWYAYSIVVLVILAFVFSVIQRVRSGSRWDRAVSSTFGPFLVAGVVSALLLLSFQYNLVERILATSYADLHAIYQAPFAIQIRLFPNRLGWYFIGVILLGAALSIVVRNVPAMLCSLAAAGTFLLFIQTQLLAEHHFLPVAFWLFVPYVLAANWVGSRLPHLGMAPFAAAGAVIFILSVAPSLNKGGPYIASMLPRYASFPLHLDNYDEYERLIGDLHDRLGNGQTLVVYSFGQSISDALLTALDPSLKPNINNVSYNPAMTMFRLENLHADWAIVRTDKRRLHYPPTMENIAIPNELILEGRGFGAAFQRVASYQMSEGQSVALFRRTRPVTVAEASDLIASLNAVYGKPTPSDGSMEIPFALRRDMPGDVFGSIRSIGPNALFIHPGLNQPSSTSIPIDSHLVHPTALLLSIPEGILQSCPLANGVNASVFSNGVDVWNGTVSPGETGRVDIPTDLKEIKITIDKRGDPVCDHVTATFEFAGANLP